jgi:protein-S-isoprenylcysteine O-methyltransferase Ste14
MEVKQPNNPQTNPAGDRPNALHRLFNHSGLRKFLLKARVPLGLIGAVVLAFNVKPEWFWIGLAVSATGELLQLWCFGALHKKQTLATNGPYKVVRNPMYLARYLLVLGCLMFLGVWWVLVVFSIVYYYYMVNRVRREEEKLLEIFGEPYLNYCQQVSRFVPFKGISPTGTFLFFDWRFFRENNAIRNGVLQFVYYVLCYGLTFRPWA